MQSRLSLFLFSRSINCFPSTARRPAGPQQIRESGIQNHVGAHEGPHQESPAGLQPNPAPLGGEVHHEVDGDAPNQGRCVLE